MFPSSGTALFYEKKHFRQCFYAQNPKLMGALTWKINIRWLLKNLWKWSNIWKKNSDGSRFGYISFRWFPDLKLFWNRCKEIWPDTACFPGTCGQNSKIKKISFWFISGVVSGLAILNRNQTKSFPLYGSVNLNYRTLWLIDSFSSCSCEHRLFS